MVNEHVKSEKNVYILKMWTASRKNNKPARNAGFPFLAEFRTSIFWEVSENQ